MYYFYCHPLERIEEPTLIANWAAKERPKVEAPVAIIDVGVAIEAACKEAACTPLDCTINWETALNTGLILNLKNYYKIARSPAFLVA